MDIQLDRRLGPVQTSTILPGTVCTMDGKHLKRLSWVEVPNVGQCLASDCSPDIGHMDTVRSGKATPRVVGSLGFGISVKGNKDKNGTVFPLQAPVPAPLFSQNGVTGRPQSMSPVHSRGKEGSQKSKVLWQSLNSDETLMELNQEHSNLPNPKTLGDSNIQIRYSNHNEDHRPNRQQEELVPYDYVGNKTAKSGDLYANSSEKYGPIAPTEPVALCRCTTISPGFDDQTNTETEGKPEVHGKHSLSERAKYSKSKNEKTRKTPKHRPRPTFQPGEIHKSRKQETETDCGQRYDACCAANEAPCELTPNRYPTPEGNRTSRRRRNRSAPRNVCTSTSQQGFVVQKSVPSVYQLKAPAEIYEGSPHVVALVEPGLNSVLTNTLDVLPVTVSELQGTPSCPNQHTSNAQCETAKVASLQSLVSNRSVDSEICSDQCAAIPKDTADIRSDAKTDLRTAPGEHVDASLSQSEEILLRDGWDKRLKEPGGSSPERLLKGKACSHAGYTLETPSEWQSDSDQVSPPKGPHTLPRANCAVMARVDPITPSYRHVECQTTGQSVSQSAILCIIVRIKSDFSLQQYELPSLKYDFQLKK